MLSSAPVRVKPVDEEPVEVSVVRLAARDCNTIGEHRYHGQRAQYGLHGKLGACRASLFEWLVTGVCPGNPEFNL